MTPLNIALDLQRLNNDSYYAHHNAVNLREQIMNAPHHQLELLLDALIENTHKISRIDHEISNLLKEAASLSIPKKRTMIDRLLRK